MDHGGGKAESVHSDETGFRAELTQTLFNVQARVLELPTACHVCGLTLVSSPHLARSYHHLFPVRPFQEVSPTELASIEVSG